MSDLNTVNTNEKEPIPVQTKNVEPEPKKVINLDQHLKNLETTVRYDLMIFGVFFSIALYNIFSESSWGGYFFLLGIVSNTYVYFYQDKLPITYRDGILFFTHFSFLFVTLNIIRIMFLNLIGSLIYSFVYYFLPLVGIFTFGSNFNWPDSFRVLVNNKWEQMKQYLKSVKYGPQILRVMTLMYQIPLMIRAQLPLYYSLFKLFVVEWWNHMLIKMMSWNNSINKNKYSATLFPTPPVSSSKKSVLNPNLKTKDQDAKDEIDIVNNILLENPNLFGDMNNLLNNRTLETMSKYNQFFQDVRNQIEDTDDFEMDLTSLENPFFKPNKNKNKKPVPETNTKNQ